MVSKKEKKRFARYVMQRTRYLDMELSELFVQEMKFDRKMRNKGLRLAKKRKKQVDSWVV